MNDVSLALRRTPTRADRAVALARRFQAGAAVVGIMGLGYVGLPLAQAVTRAGHRVIGFDVDRSRIAQLSHGRSHISHLGSELVGEMVASGAFTPTADFRRLEEVDAIIVCVPTPLDAAGRPDLSAVTAAAGMIARHLRPDQLIAFESTSYPGTTREIVLPVLEANGLRAARDFFLAYSPEREDPGNPRFSTQTTPKLVAGFDEEARRVALAFYGRVVERPVPVSSIEVAEAAKLAENVFRAVNVALANEMKLAFDAMGVDVWEVIEAARTKPFGYMPFYPGPGVGGHCIPVDPVYFSWRARGLGVQTPLVDTAMHVNSSMVAHVTRRLEAGLRQDGATGLDGRRVLVVGVAYKRNVEDVRASPGLLLMDRLEAEGARCDYFDPLVREIPPMPDHPGLAGRRSLAWSIEALRGFDAAVIAADHDGVDYDELIRTVRLIVDTRNRIGRSGLMRNGVVKA